MWVSSDDGYDEDDDDDDDATSTSTTRRSRFAMTWWSSWWVGDAKEEDAIHVVSFILVLILSVFVASSSLFMAPTATISAADERGTPRRVVACLAWRWWGRRLVVSGSFNDDNEGDVMTRLGLLNPTTTRGEDEENAVATLALHGVDVISIPDTIVTVMCAVLKASAS